MSTSGTFLLEAQHIEMAEALEAHEEIITETGETINPTLHVALHGVVANQLNEPMSRRDVADGFSDWPGSATTGTRDAHDHGSGQLVPVPGMTAKQPFEREVYRRQLNELPGTGRPPEEIGRS